MYFPLEPLHFLILHQHCLPQNNTEGQKNEQEIDLLLKELTVQTVSLYSELHGNYEGIMSFLHGTNIYQGPLKYMPGTGDSHNAHRHNTENIHNT